MGAQASPLTQPALVVLFPGTPETPADSGLHREAGGARTDSQVQGRFCPHTAQMEQLRSRCLLVTK